MISIEIGEPGWLSSFPHLVAPKKDEWLLSLLLRSDRENDWFSGTTAAFLSRFPTGPQTLGRPGGLIVASCFALEELAKALVCSLNDILATTFSPALTRLYAPIAPNPAQLGPSFPFRVCPACVASDQLLLRSTVLPHINFCPQHHLNLQTVCKCGVLLRPFSPRSKPFTCKECGLPWAQLPSIPGSQDQLEVEARLLSFYNFFLSQGAPEFITQALQLIRSRALENKEPRAKLLDGTPLLKRSSYYGNVSLASLVLTLVSLGISIEQIGSSEQSSRPHQLCCLNQVCPMFSVENAGNIHRYGHRDGIQEWYCSTCGSRYIGNRLCMSFDLGCTGDATSSASFLQAVERAQKRLTIWKRGLDKVCLDMLARGEPIAVENAFAQAGIPGTANLRAAGLGLVQMVAYYAERQQSLLPAGRQERWAARTHMHRQLRRFKRSEAVVAGCASD